MSGRKRTVGLEMEEIQRHFNMPITQAAREMKVGLTEMGLSEYEAIMLEEHRRLIEELPDLELTERTKKLRQACFKASYKKRRLSAAYS
ncbi:hypothetical protein NC653_030058 [Populus alba x Populus x berolinensis]|uniref:RWP-RK domain-containing protein n=1 Tax=Populus alba x Populus x berolinensis TaxID=444605 RepID=A0AAD6LY42_9ROSI|nr:hypothetical protein NC653_030058 [Populus alba x Populus x berolinensis]